MQNYKPNKDYCYFRIIPSGSRISAIIRVLPTKFINNLETIEFYKTDSMLFIRPSWQYFRNSRNKNP